MSGKKRAAIRAAIYVRVSTVEQETDLQEAELLEYSGRRGWESILYRDRGQSGAKQDRPALNARLSLGVDIVCLKQSIDTTLPAGRLTFQVLGAVAEFEREMLRERVKAGMAQARRSGKRIGRPALRHFSRKDVERVRSLRTQGKSVRQLAKELGTTQWMVARPGASPQLPQTLYPADTDPK